jgi:hypothetical protein
MSVSNIFKLFKQQETLITIMFDGHPIWLLRTINFDYLEPNQNWVWFLELKPKSKLKLNLVLEQKLEPKLGFKIGIWTWIFVEKNWRKKVYNGC